ncbi:hypothetical protein CPB83DRAFT_850006 [Crepidotus variabilis]|uniref:Nephrocystin 3-like N-terminal domain-containing protein n=1 Tax=Crepidotus variabilis TaxID=179855 RepID=A0A9P6JSJ1_9AGAR|nr:hypothetical protein CPB83DRAFT_850006 [Crepidotus variabilis]
MHAASKTTKAPLCFVRLACMSYLERSSAQEHQLPTVSFFNNASNLNFQGNNNFVAGNVVMSHNLGMEPIELLLSYCALDALVDSKERHDPPRCSKDTREGIHQHIISWARSTHQLTSILWLYGSAGAGKSAICQTISERFNQEKTFLATFFFSRVAGSSGRSNGDRLIPTLVYQLQRYFPEAQRHIKDELTRNRSILESTRSTQMTSLFTTPLNRFSIRRLLRKLTSRQVGLVVIDGLDECQGSEVQCDLLRIIAEAARDITMPLRFLIASRPESHLQHTFDHHPSFHEVDLHRINLDEDKAARSSIMTFYQDEFRKIHNTHPLREHLDPSWPSLAVIELLVSKSSPQFIFASTIMKYVAYLSDRPDIRLNAILNAAKSSANDFEDQPFADIDKLYKFIFEGLKEKHRQVVACILGIVHLASCDEFTVPTPSPCIFEKLFDLHPGAVNIMLDPLLSILSIPKNREMAIRSLHASLFDFLLDRHRSGGRYIDLQTAHQVLLKYYGKRDLTPVTRSALKGIIYHADCTEMTREMRSSVLPIAIAALNRILYPSGNRISPLLGQIELLELAFGLLMKAAMFERDVEDDVWLIHGIKTLVRQLKLPNDISNPFTLPLLRTKHVVLAQLLQKYPRAAALSCCQHYIQFPVIQFGISISALHLIIAVMASKRPFIQLSDGKQTVECLLNLGATIAKIKEQPASHEQETLLACKALVLDFCESTNPKTIHIDSEELQKLSQVWIKL